MTFPRCYESQQDFDNWRAMAIKAQEQSTPCSDCSRPFKQRMAGMGRCDEMAVRREFIVFPNKSKKEDLPA